MRLFDYPGTTYETKAALNELILLSDLYEQNWARVLIHVEARLFKFHENLCTLGDIAERPNAECSWRAIVSVATAQAISFVRA